jgi:hypothetical protein
MTVAVRSFPMWLTNSRPVASPLGSNDTFDVILRSAAATTLPARRRLDS